MFFFCSSRLANIKKILAFELVAYLPDILQVTWLTDDTSQACKTILYRQKRHTETDLTIENSSLPSNAYCNKYIESLGNKIRLTGKEDLDNPNFCRVALVTSYQDTN